MLGIDAQTVKAAGCQHLNNVRVRNLEEGAKQGLACIESLLKAHRALQMLQLIGFANCG